MMKTHEKPLFLLRNGDKFIHNNELHTLFVQEGNMAEVFVNGRFWAWPTWTGKSFTIVNAIVNESQPAKHSRASV
jgi:hypothetical protein